MFSHWLIIWDNPSAAAQSIYISLLRCGYRNSLRIKFSCIVYWSKIHRKIKPFCICCEEHLLFKHNAEILLFILKREAELVEWKHLWKNAAKIPLFADPISCGREKHNLFLSFKISKALRRSLEEVIAGRGAGARASACLPLPLEGTRHQRELSPVSPTGDGDRAGEGGSSKGCQSPCECSFAFASSCLRHQRGQGLEVSWARPHKTQATERSINCSTWHIYYGKQASPLAM